MTFAFPATFEDLNAIWVCVPPAKETCTRLSGRLIKHQLKLCEMAAASRPSSKWGPPTGPPAASSHLALLDSACSVNDPVRMGRLAELLADDVLDSREFFTTLDVDDIARFAEQLVSEL